MTANQGSWENTDFSHGDDLLAFPFIQWVNDGATLEPRQKRGGWAISKEQGIELPGAIEVEIHHKNGETTDALFTQSLDLAVLAGTLTWKLEGVRVPGYVEGAKGRTRALCLVKGVEGIVMVTLRGYTGKRFSQARSQWERLVRVASKSKAKGWAFYASFIAGEVEAVGRDEQSNITPIVLGADKADLNASFIGSEAVDALNWDEIDAWANYAPPEDTEATNGNGDVHFDDLPPADAQAAVEADIPF